MSVIDDIMQEINSASRRMCTNEIPSKYYRAIGTRKLEEIIRRNLNGKGTDVPAKDGWIPVEERLPEEKRANYEVTFINECGYEEHGFARWYDGEFHVPAVVIAWRNHLEPYHPERSDNHDRAGSD